MELVEWRELCDGQCLTFGCDGRQRRPDQVVESGGRIVLTHFGGGIDHGASPVSWYRVVPLVCYTVLCGTITVKGNDKGIDGNPAPQLRQRHRGARPHYRG